MSDRPRVGPGIFLPPDGTVEFFRAKATYPLSRMWWDVWEGEHARAFTAAKLADRQLMERLRASLDNMLANGGTFEMWKAQILPELRAAGWWGVVDNAALTGVDYPVFIGEARLRIIYDTNLRMARAAGFWKRIQELKEDRPFLMYTAVLDNRTRPQHRAWDGIILPVDHPWWMTHFPPNGWNCRCSVIQLSQDDLDREGWKVTENPPDDGTFDYVRGDGIIERVPKGIDPGFAYNVGVEHMRAFAPSISDAVPGLASIIADTAMLPEITARAAGADRRLRAGMTAEEAEGEWNRLVGRKPGEDRFIYDPTGEPIVISDNFWRGARGELKILKRDRERYLPYILDTLNDPDEIWYDWEEDDPARRRPGTRARQPGIVRRMLARFSIDGENIEIAVIVQVDRDGWRVLTAFPPTRNQLQSRRGGHLAYRRTNERPGS